MAPHATAPVTLMARDGEYPESEDDTLSPTIIGGIILAAVLAVGLAAWLATRWYRKHASAKFEQQHASASMSYDDVYEKASRCALRPRRPHVVLLFLPTPLERQRRHARARSPAPRRVARRDPRALHSRRQAPAALHAPPPPPPPSPLTLDSMSQRSPGGRPLSTASWSSRVMSLSGGPASKRMSTMSVLSATSSIGSGAGPAQKKVRQLFDPVLPDEIVVSLGETLTVVQRHDDGWCIVGRDSVFKPGEVELGAAPAWCFLKPVKGLRAERPMRVSSLGVTVNVDAPRANHRESVMSWSNF
ncbi:hypothetical protein C8Q80DRAFT_626397 [Daedaleopsis nitida]|nr:hypothetical protein C8Q80DRAFT_626397 [Daedaleopsis nitida]